MDILASLGSLIFPIGWGVASPLTASMIGFGSLILISAAVIVGAQIMSGDRR